MLKFEPQFVLHPLKAGGFSADWSTGIRSRYNESQPVPAWRGRLACG